MWIEWHIRWRGDEATVRWEDGTVTSDNAVTAAFGRFPVSNAPMTDRPPKDPLRDPAIAAHMFADAIREARNG